jgi:hypothetical protein
MTKASEYPSGWDEQRVLDLIAHYEGQTEAEAVAEDEAAFDRQGATMDEAPTMLLPADRDLSIKG